ncbi:PH domain-containing protein [Micromonospora sp. CA-244673]|uniref:PH domain-containing protein n=1 Tax=Micromonospora sp. CA-244673 TaxID=3239958 RepID=UPI003D940888
MSRWRRPYSLDIATGFALLGLVAAVAVGTFLVAGHVRGSVPAPLAVLAVLWLIVAVTVTARQAMLGVYVSARGLRSRSLLRTTTVPWASVARIRNGTASIAGLDMGRVAIVIDRTDGPSVQTPLQRGDLFRPFTFRPELGRLATWPEHYDEILAILQAHHHDAQRRGQAPPEGRPGSPAGWPPSLPGQSTPPAGRPAAGGVRQAGPSTGIGPASGVPSADRRRDIHALTRQHERGALTDAELAAELARIHGAGRVEP